MRIYFWDFTHDSYYPALVSERATVEEILQKTVPQVVRERRPEGQIVAYLQKTGEQLFAGPDGRYVRRGASLAYQGSVPNYPTLHPWQTLASAGVFENEVLVLCYHIRPGMPTADLNERIVQEHKWLKELASKSDLVEVEAIEGNPPRRYRVTLKCKGIMLHPINKKPSLTANHIMDIYLPAGKAGYPNEKPIVRCLTPHFHPNISQENNLVCIGEWNSSLDIAWLVSHLADMITYRVYDFEEPFNQEAVKWTKANKNKLPVDRRPLFKQAKAAAARKGKEVEMSFEKPITVSKVAKKTGQPKRTKTSRKPKPQSRAPKRTKR
jgi:ubiquitin-protein ligase